MVGGAAVVSSAFRTTIGKKSARRVSRPSESRPRSRWTATTGLDYPLVDAVARRTRRRCMDAADSSRAAADARGAGMGSAGAAGQ